MLIVIHKNHYKPGSIVTDNSRSNVGLAVHEITRLQSFSQSEREKTMRMDSNVSLHFAFMPTFCYNGPIIDEVHEQSSVLVNSSSSSQIV